MEAKGQIPVFDAVNYKKHARVVTTADGRKRVDKRPIQKSVQAVDACGNLLWMPLYTGPSQKAENDQYRQSIEHAKRKAGWVIFGRCPQIEGHDVISRLPDAVRGRPMCKVGAKGGPISDQDPCRCMLDLIAARRQENKERTVALEGQARNNEERAFDMQGEILKATLEQNARIAKVLERGSGDKGGK